MTTRVYKYGARPAGADIREQMKLGHDYYNHLVEAENGRRVEAWGAEHPPPPPHPDIGDPPCRCAECRGHWKTIRDRVYECHLDLKPLRKVASAGGLYWGTYLLIEQAFAAAVKKTGPLKTVAFRSWRQGMIAGVQVQRRYRERGITNALYRIAAAPDNRTGRRTGQRHTVELRLGTDRGRPRFSEPIKIEKHRPLGGEVTWVTVVLRHIADREVWSVNFTCSDVPDQRGAKRGAVAIDVSWRLLDHTMRVAYARDDQGNESEFSLSASWCELTKRADRIRSERDRRLLDLQTGDVRFVALKSPQSVARVARAEGIDDPEVTAWIKRERHLWQYETGCRRRSVASRRAQTLEWVRDLRDRYRIAIVKKTSHKKLKERKDLHRPARRQGHHAAPGEVIETITRVFGREDGVCVVPAVHTTNTCPDCGHENDHGSERMVACEGCGVENDRDSVSTRNMLRAYATGETSKPTARKTTSRFAKRHASWEEGDNASATA